jgi:hypothetical protein
MAVLEALDRVPNAKLREHFLALEAEEVTAKDVAAQRRQRRRDDRDRLIESTIAK